jgi:uncharacterized membrane protein
MPRYPEPTFFALAPLLAWALAAVLPAQERNGALPRSVIPVLVAAAAAAFAWQSAARHWQFASGSHDLGLFYQTHWLLAHGLPPINTVLGLHAFADHMAVVDLLVAQFLRVYDGPETLLLAQACAAASGALPLAWLARHTLGSDRAALAAASAWLLSPDVHAAVMFDYNPTTLGSAGLLWTAWALVCRGPAAALVTALATCLAKENLCPYVAVLALVLARRAAGRRRCAAVAGLALVVFAVDMHVLLGSTIDSRGYPHWQFEDLGDTPAAAAASALANPARTAALLVDREEKRRSLLQPLMTAGYLGIGEPVSLMLQAPNWCERFLSTHRNRWWGYYYGMPAAAMAAVGLVLGWRRLRHSGFAGRLPVYVVSCALLADVAPPYRTPGGNRGSDLFRLRQPYSSSREDVRTQRAAVAFVGRDTSVRVAAQHHLLPHLAGRPFVVLLDRALEADVVVLQVDGGTYPGGRPGWRRLTRELWATGAFRVAFCEGRSVVLRRADGPSVPCPSWSAVVGDRQAASVVGSGQ